MTTPDPEMTCISTIERPWGWSTEGDMESVVTSWLYFLLHSVHMYEQFDGAVLSFSLSAVTSRCVDDVVGYKLLAEKVSRAAF